MTKSLKGLKKEDWNRLFPIELVDHNPEWKNIFEKEKQRILDKVGKGYNTDGANEQIFHIHMCPKDNVMWKQIIFRDYLNANKKRAKEYENLKLELASKFKNDRGAYVLGKTDFVNETINIATKNDNISCYNFNTFSKRIG